MAEPLISNLLPAVIGGLVGGAATLIAGLVLYQKRRNNERTNLRIALLSELNSMHIIKLISRETNITPDLSHISKAVFEGNTGSIGLLTPKEVHMLVLFYSTLEKVIPQNERLSEEDISSDVVRESVRTNHLALKDNWEDARDAISENLSNSQLRKAEFEEIEVIGYNSTSDVEIKNDWLEEFGLENNETDRD